MIKKKLTDRQLLKLIQGITYVGESVCTDIEMDIIKNRPPLTEREKELHDLFIDIYHAVHWSLSKCCRSEEHQKELIKKYKELIKQGYTH